MLALNIATTVPENSAYGGWVWLKNGLWLKDIGASSHAVIRARARGWRQSTSPIVRGIWLEEKTSRYNGTGDAHSRKSSSVSWLEVVHATPHPL